VSEEEQERIEMNKQELDRYLGVYPYDTYKKWVSLTNHITPTILNRLVPLCGKISAVSPLQSVSSTTQSRRQDLAESERLAAEQPTSTCHDKRAAQKHDDRLPDMKPCPGTMIRFSEIQRLKFPDKSSASDVTHHSMDRSYMLRSMLDSDKYAGDILAVLGEMQFAFICFLIGQVFEAFEQWKVLVDLLCSCVDAMQELPTLYSQFISVVHYHAAEIPEDFFVDIVSRENFLTSSLRKFFENLESCDGGREIAELKKKGLRFRKHLELRFHWDFGCELGEYAPVLVTE